MSLAMNNQNPEPAVDISDLWFSYNGHPVLKNVNLAVQQGDFMAVIGPNGGGKTTLIKLLLGLLTPVRGRVRVLGCHPKEAATKVGYVPQETGVRINAPVTVLNVVLMGRMKGWSGFRPYSKADRNAARLVMEHFRVWDFRHRRMNQLSGGQRQRVLVARALVGNPSLLLLDEPTANFDSQSQSEFYELLRIENQTKTIMVVSHDLMVLSSYIKSVACVSQQVHFHNRPEITQDMLQMAYHCPVELIAHGLPHRVLSLHKED